MKLSRDLLFAYVDGELSAEEARRVAEEVAKDAELHAYVEAQKTLKAQLQAAFKPIMEAPAPERLARAVNETPIPESKTVAPLAGWARHGFLKKLLRAPALLPAGAMAAGIVLGFLLADSFGMGGDISGQGGRLITQGQLSRALSNRLAEDDASGSATRIGVSFVSRAGQFCRSFETARAEGTVAGIACRDNALWRIAALSSEAPRARTEFQQAASGMPAAIRDALNGMIVGNPLDADAERAARNQGWRAR
jgi:hypothetical protein